MTALPLQAAIFAALTAAAPVTALIGQRAYDEVPKGPELIWPYVTIFDMQTVEDGTDCRGADEVFVNIHVWSKKPGAVEARQIAAAVRNALHEAPLILTGAALVDIAFERDQYLREGEISHLVLTFRALTEAA